MSSWTSLVILFSPRRYLLLGEERKRVGISLPMASMPTLKVPVKLLGTSPEQLPKPSRLETQIARAGLHIPG